MGQSTSSSENSSPDQPTLEIVFPDDLFKHTKNLSELAFLSYDEFISYVEELNNLTEKCLDAKGKRLLFAIKKGTDDSMLWKSTVRIACVTIDPEHRKVESYKLMNLPQFMKVFHGLESQLSDIENVTKIMEDSTISNKCEVGNSVASPSILRQFSGIDFTDSDISSSTDCCICLERKPDVLLPCTHSYCLPCIEQWNVNNKTCPLCRETLTSTDDTWVLYDAPNVAEISEEVCTTLNNLTGSLATILASPDSTLGGE